MVYVTRITSKPLEEKHCFNNTIIQVIPSTPAEPDVAMPIVPPYDDKTRSERPTDFRQINKGYWGEIQRSQEPDSKEDRTEAFKEIYESGEWARAGKPKSGAGSTVEGTANTRRIITTILYLYNLTSMLDIPCGDLTWMPLVWESYDFRYIGADIVPPLIENNKKKYPDQEFMVLDAVQDTLPEVDLIFCRDALQHLKEADIIKALDNFSNSKAKFLLTTTYLRQAEVENLKDIHTGGWNHRNLLKPPFNLGDPVVIFAEQDNIHKFLGLWRLPLSWDDGRRAK